MAYSHENSKGQTYYLHNKEVVLRGGRNQTIYFYAKKYPNDKGTPCDLPGNKKVVESKRTGLPLCKNK